jgi:hypothetical protein
MQEDLDNIIRRLNNLEGEVRQRGTFVPPAPYNPGAGSPYTPAPYYGPNWGIDPNMPYTTSGTGPATISIHNPGAMSGTISLSSADINAILNTKETE